MNGFRHAWGAGCVRAARAILLGLGALSTLPAQAAGLPLDEIEQAYVAAHPELKVAFHGITIAPLQIFDEQGRLDGIVADYLRLIEGRTGLKLRPLTAPTLAQRDAAFEQGHARLLPLLLDGDPVQRVARATPPYFRVPAVWVTRRDRVAFSTADGLAGQRVAVTPGSAFEAYLIRRYPRAQLVRVPTPLDELRAVADGRADMRIGQLPITAYTIEANLLTNLAIRGFADGGPAVYAMGVAPADTVLHGLITKALRSVSEDEHRAILDRWMPVRHFLGVDASTALLNDAQREWVRSHPELRVGYDSAFSPYSLEQGGQMRGMGAELLGEALRRVGMGVSSTRGGTWAQTLTALEAGQIDVAVAVARNEVRDDSLLFVGPWNSSPTALVTRRGERGPFELGDLGGRTLAVQSRHFLLPMIRRAYPGIRLQPHATLSEALASVRSGTAAAAMGNFQVMSQLVQRDHPGELTISGMVANGDSELYFAVPRSNPELAVILGKALDSLSENERSPIRSRWLTAEYRPGWSTAEIVRIAVAVLLVAALAALLVRRSQRRLQVEVAQRRAAEQGLAAALERERESSEAKSRFIASLGHEVRNPLAAMVSAASLLGRRRADPDEHRLIDAIRHSGDGLLELLSRTLDFSKAESGMLSISTEWVAPLQWCRRTCAPFEALARAKGLAFRVELSCPDDLQAQFDPVRLGQVLSNLLSNALKFTAAGSVGVELAVDERATPPRLRLAVSDTGPGFTAEERALLFRPYTQLASTRASHASGTGLGLALCRQIVEHMGGRIEAHGRPGEGSRFEVDVPAPLQRRPAAEVGAALAEAGALWPQGALAEPVMLVDDDPVGLLVGAEQLRSLGLTVRPIGGADEALSAWQAEPGRLLITDFHMPGMDGLELARRVRQLPVEPGRRPWIVLLTALTEPEARARFLANGADEVMTKPLPVEVFERRLAAQGASATGSAEASARAPS
ncbi:transporter substrate-binding domain-containing protein [Variovorax sp. YR752]|uniref:ATP-binding protein n=1 Tax=Variovorax sp. YR752 TaxID=1884383 RepID=UPI003137C414